MCAFTLRSLKTRRRIDPLKPPISVNNSKLQQVVGELAFPVAFSYVPWGHHILIITKCKDTNSPLMSAKT